MQQQAVQVFGFFLTPGFSLPAYTSLAEAFRIANDLAGKTLFRWYTVALDRELVRSASGLYVQPDVDITSTIGFNKLAVISSLDSHLYEDKKVFQWLRKLDSQGCELGGITSGSWVLARAKLLDGYRCTLHWQELDAFKESYPKLHATNTLFEIDRNRFTCASGMAALDMIIRMIVIDYGYQFAVNINNRLVRERIREGEERQLLPSYLHSKPIKRAVELMQKNIERPLPLEQIAQASLISQRQLARLFKTHVAATPQQYYSHIRLDRAASLLRQCDLSITEIALAAGFENLAYFSAAFKQRYLKSPSQYRSESP